MTAGGDDAAIRIQVAEFPGDVDAVQAMFREYAASLPIDVGSRVVTHEVPALPGAYAAPRGTLLVAERAGLTLGCVALRPFAWPDTAEIKRLYVTPEGRGHGLARALCTTVIAHAHRLGYREILLDTLTSMHAAQRLYRTLGFTETAPYNDAPGADFVFMKLTLPTSSDETG